MQLICAHIENSIFFDCRNRVKFCPYYDEAIAAEKLDGIWLDIDKITEARAYYKAEPPSKCSTCSLFEPAEKNKKLPPVQKLYIADWHFCFVNCTYCTYPKQENLIEAGHYDVFPIVNELADRKLITPLSKVIFECGDACAHPEFDKIMFYFLNRDFKNIQINTPAQRFCESIAQGISKGAAEVIISFDSACQYVYKLVKQTDKFHKAVENIKKYLEYQMPDKKNVILKYTITQGINDNIKEPLDLFIFARDLGIKKLIFDIEQNYFENCISAVPLHIKNIINFLKDTARYNMYDIEFSARLNALSKIEN